MLAQETGFTRQTVYRIKGDPAAPIRLRSIEGIPVFSIDAAGAQAHRTLGVPKASQVSSLHCATTNDPRVDAPVRSVAQSSVLTPANGKEERAREESDHCRRVVRTACRETEDRSASRHVRHVGGPASRCAYEEGPLSRGQELADEIHRPAVTHGRSLGDGTGVPPNLDEIGTSSLVCRASDTT